MNKIIGLFVIMMLLFLFFIPSVTSNRGLIKPSPYITIEENAQNAIIAWNGTQEVLILSTDVTSSESTRVLEILPLPSDPLEVKEGSFDSFNELERIINDRLGWYNWGRSKGHVEMGDSGNEGIEITFQEQIGTHDITIVKVINLSFFVEWANDFAVDNGIVGISFSEDFKNCIEYYLDLNISYFVFDFIDVNQTQHSINPIIYRFNTSRCYFPLNITAFSDVGETNSEVNLFLITKYHIGDDEIAIPPPLKYNNSIWLTDEDIEKISSDINQLFKWGCFLFAEPGVYPSNYDPEAIRLATLTIVKYRGLLSDLKEDINFYFITYQPNMILDNDEEIFIQRNEEKIMSVTVNNSGDMKFENVTLAIKTDDNDSLSSCFTISPDEGYILEPDEEITYNVTVSIPSSISVGTYNISFIASSSTKSFYKSKNSTITLYDLSDNSGNINSEGQNIKSDIQELEKFASVLSLMVMLLVFIIVILLIILLKKK